MKEFETILHFIKELDKRITIMEESKCEDNLDKLTERIDVIEDFLTRRTRGFYLKYKNK